jgi:tetratricopeptide (TPR) repeat protein
MSRLFARIPKEVSHNLPWQALLGLFDVETITGLEKALGLKDGTLAKASRGFYGSAADELTRGLSANAHQSLLEGIATRFTDGEQMRAWMNKHWPDSLLSQVEPALEALYENVNLTYQIPQVGIFPTDYIERDEKTAILDLLLNNKQLQVLWITGPGGSGKSTLALSLVRRDWDRLKKHYEKIFWVNVEQAGYADGLRQIAESLNLVGQPLGIIEQKLHHLTRKGRVLFILDALHDVSGLKEWRQLAGILGKLVITSRTRLSENELRADGLIHQVRMGGFSLEQARRFLPGADPCIDAIIKQTDGLPLALRILNGLMLEMGLSAGEILVRLNRYTFDALEYPPGSERHAANLRACFELTWQVLLEQKPEALRYFQAAGIFQTRIIFKPILEQVASVDDPINADRLAAVLLRYNFLDILAIKGRRFVQLHPLLHAFAREKLAVSDANQQTRDAYLEAFALQMKAAWQSLSTGDYPVIVSWLARDALAVMTELMAQADWYKLSQLLSNSFDLLLQEGYTGELEEMLRALEAQIREDTLAARLFRMALANRAGQLALVRFENETARERFELAYKAGAVLVEQAGRDQEFLTEMSRAILGIGRCLLQAGNARGGLDFLDTPECKFVFGGLNNEALIADWDLLSGELYAELGNPARALEYFQTVLDVRQATGNPLQASAVLAMQADCYRQIGQLEKALEVYGSLYADVLHPVGLRAEIGLQFAGCLAENRDFSHSLSILDEVETQLADYEGWPAFDSHYARLWKYRALASFQLDDKAAALSCARKSQELWSKISGSDLEQMQLQALRDDLQKG